MTMAVAVVATVTAVDAQRAVDGTDTGADCAADDRTERTRCAITLMRAFTSAADKTLGLGSDRKRRQSKQAGGDGKTKFHLSLSKQHGIHMAR